MPPAPGLLAEGALPADQLLQPPAPLLPTQATVAGEAASSAAAMAPACAEIAPFVLVAQQARLPLDDPQAFQVLLRGFSVDEEPTDVGQEASMAWLAERLEIGVINTVLKPTLKWAGIECHSTAKKPQRLSALHQAAKSG
eukprot:15473756-Alexandrium_andersonii.AAC.1